YTILHEPVASVDLMERASLAFVKAFMQEFSSRHRVVVFAGPGNNGGDALAVARLLLDKGYKVQTYLLSPQRNGNNPSSSVLSEDCEINRSRLLMITKDNYKELSADLSFVKIDPDDIIVDGLFGSGLNRPLTGLAAELVRLINNSHAIVCSIDMPSGLFGENNEGNISENIIRATKTFTFQTPKLAFLLPGNEEYAGEWQVLDIGIHKDAIRHTLTDYHLLERKEISELLQSRDKFAFKNNFGHALVAAGSKGKMGAAVLSVKAVLRAGAGLVTAHIPARGEIIMQTVFPEAMLQLDEEEDVISNIENAGSFAAIGIGPGIGVDGKTQIALENLFLLVKIPLVIDADALNIIAQNKKMLKEIPALSILTPHVGEFDRLTTRHDSSYARLQSARIFAAETNCIIVLKGAYTAVCLPDKRVYFNSTGNPGMATAGSGDVLTGILTGLMAQSCSPEKTAQLGVYLHGLAGDIASGKTSEESLIASDIIENLGFAFDWLES
ncbi:MAG: NAD(P)H-hydrate dehydratase, partial [Bacteroidales bacterium]|nr:NAD(P)H-hydrate dehydratase [Bacteroidales bacterium]